MPPHNILSGATGNRAGVRGQGVSVALLALSVLGALWIAGRLFRANSLLSGEVPGRRALLQLLARG